MKNVNEKIYLQLNKEDKGNRFALKITTIICLTILGLTGIIGLFFGKETLIGIGILIVIIIMIVGITYTPS